MVRKSTGRAKIGLAAEAKVGATIKLERTKEVKEVIPPDVTRAKAGAWLTLISPITEWAGLKGDQLRHKRGLLRVQQEETLLQVAQKAARRIREEGLEISPVPTKFLVPFLERASLEEPESPLVDLWANLLVSAGSNYSPHYIHFASVIAQLSARQAEIFQALIGHSGSHSVELGRDSLFMDFKTTDFMEDFLRDRWKQIKQKSHLTEADEALDKLFSFLNIVAIEIQHVEIWKTRDQQTGTGGSPPWQHFKDELRTDYAILEAVGMIRFADTGDFQLDKVWTAKVLFFYLTPLGLSFAKACGLLKDDTPDDVSP